MARGKSKGEVCQLTDLAHNFIILQHAPSDVHTIVVPIGPWHLLIDIGIDTRHGAAGLLCKTQRKTGKSRRCWVIRDGDRGLSQRLEVSVLPFDARFGDPARDLVLW